jgi:hypothetical protein
MDNCWTQNDYEVRVCKRVMKDIVRSVQNAAQSVAA